MQSLIDNKGELLTCSTCMKNRQKQESDFCPIAILDDMMEIVEWVES